MHTNINEKALGACDSKRLMTDTNSADYRNHGPVNHAHDGNAVAHLIAMFTNFHESSEQHPR